MNDIKKLEKFHNFSVNKQIEFFNHYSKMKKEFKILREENTILKEGLTIEGDSQ